VSKENREIKVTDKRMFTPDGKLREEYRFLEEKSTDAEPQAAAVADARTAAPAAGSPGDPGAASHAGQGAAGAGTTGAGGGRQDEGSVLRPGAQAPAPGAASRRAGARDEPPARGGAGRDEPPGPGGSARGGGGGPHPEPPGGGHADEAAARLEFPGSPPGLGPSFYDLAAVLAEPVALYLGDMELPDGQSAENLEMARLYIDLLDVLRQKTAGNLTAQESAFLEDLLYRLRVRFVQKRG
jgi:Domain of unknown function (DUF1844)